MPKLPDKFLKGQLVLSEIEPKAWAKVAKRLFGAEKKIQDFNHWCVGAWCITNRTTNEDGEHLARPLTQMCAEGAILLKVRGCKTYKDEITSNLSRIMADAMAIYTTPLPLLMSVNDDGHYFFGSLRKVHAKVLKVLHDAAKEALRRAAK